MFQQRTVSLDKNAHRAPLISEFGSLRQYPEFVPPDIDYLFVLYTNRCGSNYLAQALASSGQVNEAGESFNSDTILFHARQQRLRSLHAYFYHLPKLVGANAWLASKLAIEHVDLLEEAGILECIRPRTHFVLLERRDQLAQAISRCIAWQNGQWTSEHPRSIPDEQLVYSRRCIDEQLDGIQFANGLLYRFLSTNRHAPVHLTYEDFLAQPQAHLDEIASRFNLPPLRFDPSRIRIVRQSNHVNAAWQRRYLAGG